MLDVQTVIVKGLIDNLVFGEDYGHEEESNPLVLGTRDTGGGTRMPDALIENTIKYGGNGLVSVREARGFDSLPAPMPRGPSG